MEMLRYCVRRAGWHLINLLGISLIVFALLSLMPDHSILILG